MRPTIFPPAYAPNATQSASRSMKASRGFDLDRVDRPEHVGRFFQGRKPNGPKGFDGVRLETANVDVGRAGSVAHVNGHWLMAVRTTCFRRAGLVPLAAWMDSPVASDGTNSARTLHQKAYDRLAGLRIQRAPHSQASTASRAAGLTQPRMHASPSLTLEIAEERSRDRLRGHYRGLPKAVPVQKKDYGSNPRVCK